jgi:hypothetical protein
VIDQQDIDLTVAASPVSGQNLAANRLPVSTGLLFTPFAKRSKRMQETPMIVLGLAGSRQCLGTSRLGWD